MSGIFDSRQVRRAFARAATSYDRHAALQTEVRKRLHERLDDAALEPATVVDLGCGTGHGTAELRKRFPRALTLGLDFALPMLRAARRRRGWRRPFALAAGDAEALPLAEASVDLLHSNLCLQWCGDLVGVLDGFRRVLRPKGMLLLSSFGPQTLVELREAFAAVDAAPHVSRFHDMHQLGDALLAAGFRDPVLERDVFTLEYDRVLDLMHELRGLGATNADTGRNRQLTGKQHLQRVIASYENLRRNGRLPATWEVVYAQARAPDAGQPRRSGAGDIASFPLDRLRGSRRQRG